MASAVANHCSCCPWQCPRRCVFTRSQVSQFLPNLDLIPTSNSFQKKDPCSYPKSPHSWSPWFADVLEGGHTHEKLMIPTADLQLTRRWPGTMNASSLIFSWRGDHHSRCCYLCMAEIFVLVFIVSLILNISWTVRIRLLLGSLHLPCFLVGSVQSHVDSEHHQESCIRVNITRIANKEGNKKSPDQRKAIDIKYSITLLFISLLLFAVSWC